MGKFVRISIECINSHINHWVADNNAVKLCDGPLNGRAINYHMKLYRKKKLRFNHVYPIFYWKCLVSLLLHVRSSFATVCNNWTMWVSYGNLFISCWVSFNVCQSTIDFNQNLHAMQITDYTFVYTDRKHDHDGNGCLTRFILLKRK